MKKYPDKESIRTAVIGYGGAFNMGFAHLKEMTDAGMTPVAVAEIDPTRLVIAKKDFPGIGTFDSVETMLREGKPDLVAIITPHNTHAPLAMRCLEAGASVVCEKPMAITLEECDQMIELAREKELVLSVYHNRHWDGCILEALDRIHVKGEIGEIFRVEAHMGGFGNPGDWWRSSRSISGGIHYDWGVHLIEYTLQLIDAEVVEVTAFSRERVWATKWGADTNQDELSAMIRFSNGALLNLRLTTLDAHPDEGQLVITGTKGKYYMEQETFRIFKGVGAEVHSVTGRNRPGEQKKYYQNIAACLTGQDELVITPEWSRRTMEILTMASRSARENQAVRV